MTDPNEWTPEARKIREAQREAARDVLANGTGMSSRVIEHYVDRLYPAPPLEHTFGREIELPKAWIPTQARRRSDGQWQVRGAPGEWSNTRTLTDDFVRQCAAELPLTAAEEWALASRVLRGEHR